MEYILIYLLLITQCFIFKLDASSVANQNYNIFDKFSEVVSLSCLPDYVVANVSNLQGILHSSIRRKAPLHKFPLTEQDKIDIKTLEAKFDNEQNCAGLAAPQIGISKRFIIFKVEEEEGVPQTFPKTIWINPSYEKASDKTELAYEQCFSVEGVTAPVKRYKYIHFKATDINGTVIQGRAEGFSARVIQHETDHLDGILFIDLVPWKKIITLQEFKCRLKKFEEKENRKKTKSKTNV